MFIKIFKKDFICDGIKIGNVIESKLFLANTRIIRWCQGNILWEKNWNDKSWEEVNKIPESWDLAYDFDLWVNSRKHRLTIHTSTAIRDFQPYLMKLEREGRRLEDVVTRMTITSWRKRNPSIRFEAVG